MEVLFDSYCGPYLRDCRLCRKMIERAYKASGKEVSR
jgi:hypothetical protein